MRTGLGPSADLRAQSWGSTCRVSAFKAPEWRKNPVFVLTRPSSRDGSVEGSCSQERSRSSSVVDDPNSCASTNSATCAARALLGQSSTTPVWRSTSKRSSESSCSRIVLVATNLCIGPFPTAQQLPVRPLTNTRSAYHRGRMNSVLSPASAARGRGAAFARVPFRLLSDHVHFFFQRRKPLQHLMNAQRHVANGFNLRAGLGRQ